MIREDGAEKTKQLAIGMIVLSVVGWLGWQWWFGNGLFEGKPLVKGQYGSMASEMVQLAFFLVIQVGAIALGLFRTGTDVLMSISRFFFGGSDATEVNTTHTSNHTLRIDGPYLPSLKPGEAEASRVAGYSNGSEVLVKKEVPIFRTEADGTLRRDLELEKHVCGPRTKEEIAQDAVDALMAGDMDRLTERYEQLHPSEKKVEAKDAKTATA